MFGKSILCQNTVRKSAAVVSGTRWAGVRRHYAQLDCCHCESIASYQFQFPMAVWGVRLKSLRKSVITGYRIDADENTAAIRRAAKHNPPPHVGLEEVIGHLGRMIPRFLAKVNSSGKTTSVSVKRSAISIMETPHGLHEVAEDAPRRATSSPRRHTLWCQTPGAFCDYGADHVPFII